MEKETYLKKLKVIKDEYESKKLILYKEYALSSALFKVNDTIDNDTFIITIDKITVWVSGFDDPRPVYHGFELKKDLTPKKSGIRASIYGNNAKLVKK